MINREYLNRFRKIPRLILLELTLAFCVIVFLIGLHVLFYRVILPHFNHTRYDLYPMTIDGLSPDPLSPRQCQELKKLFKRDFRGAKFSNTFCGVKNV